MERKKETEVAHQPRLSPWARHDPFQRHVGPNQRAKRRRERERLLPKICGPTGNTRTLLVTSCWTPQAYTGPPCRQSVYRMIQKHHIIFIFLHRSNRCLCSTLCRSSLFLLFSADEGKNASGHVTTIMPAFLLLLHLLLIVLHRLLLLLVSVPALATRCILLPSSRPSSRITHSKEPFERYQSRDQRLIMLSIPDAFLLEAIPTRISK